MLSKTISHHKVIEKIGQRGMDKVYRAKDTHLGRKVKPSKCCQSGSLKTHNRC